MVCFGLCRHENFMHLEAPLSLGREEGLENLLPYAESKTIHLMIKPAKGLVAGF
jgi:hypothetical protein